MTINQQNIIIIGATGLIGQHLVKHLISGGYKPVVLTRNTLKAKKLFGDGVQIEYWNTIDVDSLTIIINGSKAVVNLAGESIATRWTKKNKESILKSRINTTNALVHAIRACTKPPEVIIQASAIGYYPHNSSVQIDENGYVGTGFLSQVVLQWEQAATKVGNYSRLVISRTGIVLTAKGGFLSKILKPIKLYFGGWFGDGSQIISWIHIDDHVRAIQFFIENGTTKGVYNLVSPEPITYKLLVKQIGKIIKRPVWLPIPRFILKLIFGKMADEMILSNQNVVPSRLLSAGFQIKFSSIDNTLKDLIRNDNLKLK